MSANQVPAGASDRLLAEVRQHAHAEQLARLCFDVLWKQAEEQSLFRGRRQVRAGAAALALSRADCDTGLGNVRTILERGPERGEEWALIAAFAVRGLDRQLAEMDADAAAALAREFALRAPWLELATPYAPARFLNALLSAANQEQVSAALGELLCADPPEPSSTPAEAARAALYVGLLEALSAPAARRVLARLADAASSAAGRRLAQAALGARPARAGIGGPIADEAPAAQTQAQELTGHWGQVPSAPLLRALRVISGWAALAGAARMLAVCVGWERLGTIRVDDHALYVERRTRLWGRTIQVTSRSYGLRDVRGTQQVLAKPVLQQVLGVVCLAVGLLLALSGLREAIVYRDVAPLSGAAVFLLAGAGADMLLAAWGRQRRPWVGFQVYLGRRPVVSLRRVDPARARLMAERIARLLPAADALEQPAPGRTARVAAVHQRSP